MIKKVFIFRRLRLLRTLAFFSFCAFQHLAQPAEDRIFGSIDDLFNAFSSGLIPNFSDPQQVRAFELYRNVRFGNRKINISLNFSAYPLEKLQKTSFRNYTFSRSAMTYTATPTLTSFLKSQLQNFGKVKGNLFQPQANIGFWKKLLQYNEKQDGDWEKFFVSKISPSQWEELKSSSISVEDRGIKLFDILNTIAKSMEADKRNTRAIKQAMADLVQGMATDFSAIALGLKSSDGLESLRAYQKVLQERDRIALRLGYEDHFIGLKKALGVNQVAGIPSEKEHQQKLLQLEKDVRATGIRIGFTNQKTVRHLSLAESPFRSCVGGSDCSSVTYPDRALDPNYHYFTLTNTSGHSSGHITVVLGEGKLNGVPTKLAYVDKLMNVPSDEIPLLIEGARRSLLEKGYILFTDSGGSGTSGISNDSNIYAYFARDSIRNKSIFVTDFKPHSETEELTRNFDIGYSRVPFLADGAHPLHPLELDGDTEFSPGDETKSWRVNTINLQDIVANTYKLKDGSLEEKIKYIRANGVLKVSGIGEDPHFEKTILGWTSDDRSPFALKKEIAISAFEENLENFVKLYRHFNLDVRGKIIDTILQTPALRAKIFQNKELLAQILVMNRKKSNYLNSLKSYFIGDVAGGAKTLTLIQQIFADESIDDDRAKSITKLLMFASPEKYFDEHLEAIRLLENTPHQASATSNFVAYANDKNQSQAAFLRQLDASQRASDLSTAEALRDLTLKRAKHSSGDALYLLTTLPKSRQNSSLVASLAKDVFDVTLTIAPLQQGLSNEDGHRLEVFYRWVNKYPTYNNEVLGEAIPFLRFAAREARGYYGPDRIQEALSLLLMASEIPAHHEKSKQAIVESLRGSDSLNIFANICKQGHHPSEDIQQAVYHRANEIIISYDNVPKNESGSFRKLDDYFFDSKFSHRFQLMHALLISKNSELRLQGYQRIIESTEPLSENLKRTLKDPEFIHHSMTSLLDANKDERNLARSLLEKEEVRSELISPQIREEVEHRLAHGSENQIASTFMELSLESSPLKMDITDVFLLKRNEILIDHISTAIPSQNQKLRESAFSLLSKKWFRNLSFHPKVIHALSLACGNKDVMVRESALRFTQKTGNEELIKHPILQAVISSSRSANLAANELSGTSVGSHGLSMDVPKIAVSGISAAIQALSDPSRQNLWTASGFKGAVLQQVVNSSELNRHAGLLILTANELATPTTVVNRDFFVEQARLLRSQASVQTFIHSPEFARSVAANALGERASVIDLSFDILSDPEFSHVLDTPFLRSSLAYILKREDDTSDRWVTYKKMANGSIQVVGKPIVGGPFLPDYHVARRRTYKLLLNPTHQDLWRNSEIQASVRCKEFKNNLRRDLSGDSDISRKYALVLLQHEEIKKLNLISEDMDTFYFSNGISKALRSLDPRTVEAALGVLAQDEYRYLLNADYVRGVMREDGFWTNLLSSLKEGRIDTETVAAFVHSVAHQIGANEGFDVDSRHAVFKKLGIDLGQLYIDTASYYNNPQPTIRRGPDKLPGAMSRSPHLNQCLNILNSIYHPHKPPKGD